MTNGAGLQRSALPSGAGFGSVTGGREGVTWGTASYFFSTGLGFSTDSGLYQNAKNISAEIRQDRTGKSCIQAHRGVCAWGVCVGDWASPGVVVGHLCLRFVRTRLEFVEVRQLFPVVVLVLVGVVMVGAHDVISHTGVRLLWPRHSEGREAGGLKVSRDEPSGSSSAALRAQ